MHDFGPERHFQSHFYRNPGASFTIEVNTNLDVATAWFPVIQHYLLTNQTQEVPLPGDTSPASFYRAFRE